MSQMHAREMVMKMMMIEMMMMVMMIAGGHGEGLGYRNLVGFN